MASRQTFLSLVRITVARWLVVTCVVGGGSASFAQEAAAPAGMLLNRRAVGFDAATRKAFAVDEAGARVWVLDDTTGERRAIAVGREPEALAIDSGAGRVYVANTGSGTVSVIDEGSGRVVATIQAGPHPYAIAVNEGTHTVYVSNTFSDEVAVIDGASNHVAMHRWGSADDIAVNSRSNTAFLLGYEDTKLGELRAGGDGLQKIAVGNHLWSMAVDEPAGLVYVAEVGADKVIAVDEKSGATAAMRTGAFPCAAAVDAARHRVYVANYGDDTVTIIDGAHKRVVGTVKVGSHPQAVAVDEAAKLVFVANSHDDSVTVLDGQTGRVKTTLPAGSHPYTLAVSSAGHKVYVANMGGDGVTVIDTGRLAGGK